MMSDKSQPIPPVTRRLLPAVPWFLKWCGWINNRWNESVVDALLVTRDEAAVMQAWKEVLPEEDLARRLLAAISKEMGWKNALFIPEDECFVVLKLWWCGFADCWERERCMWAFEKILGKRLPSSILPAIVDMTLGDLLRHFRDNAHERPDLPLVPN